MAFSQGKESGHCSYISYLPWNGLSVSFITVGRHFDGAADAGKAAVDFCLSSKSFCRLLQTISVDNKLCINLVENS